MKCKVFFFVFVHWEYVSGFNFQWVMGTLFFFSFFWLVLWLIPSLTPFFLLLLLFWCAILSPTRVCTIFFPCTFYLLIWHVVLMQNDKTGACECVCWLYFLKCKWFCVCVYVCECKREQFTVVTGYPPALWVHMFELALNSWFLLIWIWGIWIQFVWASEHTGMVGLSWFLSSFFLQCVFLFQYVASITIGFSVFILWLAHLCEHINVYTKAKTFADSGNTWQTFVV